MNSFHTESGAHKTIEEVEILLNNGLYSTAVNRLYYAAYYAAVALLVKDNISATTHAGVRNMLGLNYIRTGKIDKTIGTYYNILFEKRHRNDYDDFIESTAEEVHCLIPLAKTFIETIDKLL